MSDPVKYPSEPGDPFGPQYPDLGTGVAKFRRMASGGIADMDPALRRSYGEAVETAIKSKQRSELIRAGTPPPPIVKDVGASLRAKQRNALLAYPGAARRAREPDEWQKLYDEAMNAKKAVEKSPASKKRGSRNGRS